VKAGECPCVADLIEFAQGLAGDEERQRIEQHISTTSCSHCRRWIDKALANLGKPAPTSGSTPAVERRAVDGTKWRRQAFLDLEQRLRHLEDGV